MIIAESPDAGVSAIWAAIIGVIGVAVGALVNGVYTLLKEQHVYRLEYYKTVVAKRLDAYEALESLLVALKTSTVDSDGRTYHVIFSEDDFEGPHRLVMRVFQHALWLNDRAFRTLQELNRLFYDVRPEAGSIVEFAKSNYGRIAELRSQLEDWLAEDIAQLHNVRAFFRQRKEAAAAGLEVVRLGATHSGSPPNAG